MTELTSLLLLAAGLGALAATGVLGACCLRVQSPIEFLLATYVLGWSWLVALILVLSPPGLVTRGWLMAGIGAGLVAVVAAWFACARPRPPALLHAAAALRRALREPAIAALAVAVSLGVSYTCALAVFTPVNEGDAHAYHLARAAFWRQAHELGYVASALEPRLNVNPPNAEIGQLATMLLSGSDRYVALPQLAAYAALVLGVAGLARRIGLTRPESVFGALAFATLPVVAVQASGALNDLVVASFLTIAAVFAMRTGRASLLLLALSLGLAVGTKFTAVLALPALAVVVALVRPARQWAAIAIAGAGGLLIGSAWYVLNLVETGAIDGGLADAAEQRVELSFATVAWTATHFTFDLVDMSGAGRPYAWLFVAAALVLAGIGVVRARRSLLHAVPFLLGALLAAGIAVLPTVAWVHERTVFKAWLLLGSPDPGPPGSSSNLNVDADAVQSWFGPLGMLLITALPVIAIVLRLRGRVSTAFVALTLGPWLLLLTFSLTIVWDPWRGRFLIFGVALAAATWGFLMRWPAAAGTAAAIGAIALALSLANHLGKPSGLSDVWAPTNTTWASTRSIWGAPRWDAQTRLRLGEDEGIVYRYLETHVPTDARLTLALRGNDFIFPYFGARLTRHVSLVPSGGSLPADAEWLVVSPSKRVAHCPDAWRQELSLESGWRIERRLAPDACVNG